MKKPSFPGWCAAAALLAGGAHAAPADIAVVSLTKLSETRVTRTEYDYVFQVNVRNGAQALRGARQALVGAGAGTTIIDGSVQIGALGPNAVASPADTITLRHNRTLPFDERALRWNASGTAADSFVKGADIGWLSEMLAAGRKFYNAAGVQQDLLATLKEHGLDAIRLRVWVNPAPDASGKVYNDIHDVARRAQQVKAAGMKLMIDFHYSDSWADPGQQTKPAAWKYYNQQQLGSAVAAHTRDSLQLLKSYGITPDWVQVGNETNNGMLWDSPDNPAGGRASTNMKGYAELTASGYNAVKSVFPATPVIVHVSNCHNAANFSWIFNGLRTNGGKFDIIAGSDYPTHVTGQTWQQVNSACAANMANMAQTFNVPVMISEVGAPWDHPDAKLIVADLIARMRGIPGGRGLGVFYWEPQAYDWKGYTLGAWDRGGKPMPTMAAFLEESGPSSIRARSNGKCLEVSQNSTYAGAWITGAWACGGAANQQWIIQDMQADYLRFKALSSGMCIDVAGASRAEGAMAVQAACSSAPGQQWWLEDMGDGSVSIHSRLSDKCLAARPDTALAQASCNAADPAQRFLFPARVRMQSVASKLCAGIHDNSAWAGAWITGAACGANASQQWTFEAQGDQYLRLQVASTGMCLDLTSQSVADGVYAVQQACASAATQQWKKETFSDGSYRLRSRYSGKCIAMGGQYTAFQQFACSDSALDQRWRDF